MKLIYNKLNILLITYPFLQPIICLLVIMFLNRFMIFSTSCDVSMHNIKTIQDCLLPEDLEASKNTSTSHFITILEKTTFVYVNSNVASVEGIFPASQVKQVDNMALRQNRTIVYYLQNHYHKFSVEERQKLYHLLTLNYLDKNNIVLSHLLLSIALNVNDQTTVLELKDIVTRVLLEDKLFFLWSAFDKGDVENRFSISNGVLSLAQMKLTNVSSLKNHTLLELMTQIILYNKARVLNMPETFMDSTNLEAYYKVKAYLSPFNKSPVSK